MKVCLFSIYISCRVFPRRSFLTSVHIPCGCFEQLKPKNNFSMTFRVRTSPAGHICLNFTLLFHSFSIFFLHSLYSIHTFCITQNDVLDPSSFFFVWEASQPAASAAVALICLHNFIFDFFWHFAHAFWITHHLVHSSSNILGPATPPSRLTPPPPLFTSQLLKSWSIQVSICCLWAFNFLLPQSSSSSSSSDSDSLFPHLPHPPVHWTLGILDLIPLEYFNSIQTLLKAIWFKKTGKSGTFTQAI